jgi:hypothetical protein
MLEAVAMAKKLVLAPERYDGMWTIGDTRVSGKCCGRPTWPKTPTLCSFQRWNTAYGDVIELKFLASASHHGWYGLGVTTSPVVQVKGQPRTVEEWMSRYVLPLAEITTLATERRQSVSWVLVRPTQVFSADIDEQAAYEAAEPEFRAMISEQHSSLIPLGPSGVDLAEVLTRWHVLRNEHHTFHEYLTLRRREPTMSARARFLAAVPALEALHDALHGPPPPGRGEQVRTEVLDRVRRLPDLAADDLDYLNRHLAPPQGYKLAHRLRVLVEDDLGADLRALIAKRTDPLPEFLVLEGAKGQQTIWETVAKARNRIAHGGTPVPSVEQISALMRLAHTLATALALGQLGVPDEALRAGITHEQWSMV